MWAAAGSEPSTPVLEWLCEITAGVPDIHFNEGTLSTNVGVRSGWQALREALRSWGVGQEADLQGVVAGSKFPGPQPGNHISARKSCVVGGNFCDHNIGNGTSQCTSVCPNSQCGNRVHRASQVPLRVDHSSWASLDRVDLEDLFSQRIPMLKSCPHFFRGRLRQFQDSVGRTMSGGTRRTSWQRRALGSSSAVVPMLLSRPRRIGRIGRDELASRADQFARGDWPELIDLAVQNVSSYTDSKREDSSEAERRGLAAQERVRGQVSRARQALAGAALSPMTEETLEELQRRRPQAALRQIPQEDGPRT